MPGPLHVRGPSARRDPFTSGVSPHAGTPSQRPGPFTSGGLRTPRPLDVRGPFTCGVTPGSPRAPGSPHRVLVPPRLRHHPSPHGAGLRPVCRRPLQAPRHAQDHRRPLRAVGTLTGCGALPPAGAPWPPPALAPPAGAPWPPPVRSLRLPIPRPPTPTPDHPRPLRAAGTRPPAGAPAAPGAHPVRRRLSARWQRFSVALVLGGGRRCRAFRGPPAQSCHAPKSSSRRWRGSNTPGAPATVRSGDGRSPGRPPVSAPASRAMRSPAAKSQAWRPRS